MAPSTWLRVVAVRTSKQSTPLTTGAPSGFLSAENLPQRGCLNSPFTSPSGTDWSRNSRLSTVTRAGDTYFPSGVLPTTQSFVSHWFGTSAATAAVHFLASLTRITSGPRGLRAAASVAVVGAAGSSGVADTPSALIESRKAASGRPRPSPTYDGSGPGQCRVNAYH